MFYTYWNSVCQIEHSKIKRKKEKIIIKLRENFNLIDVIPYKGLMNERLYFILMDFLDFIFCHKFLCTGWLAD